MQKQYSRVNIVKSWPHNLHGFDIVKVSDQLLFAFGESRILVATPLNVYELHYYHRNYINQFTGLRNAVEQGQIMSISDLVSYCRYRPGINSQMYGLGMIVTDLRRYL